VHDDDTHVGSTRIHVHDGDVHDGDDDDDNDNSNNYYLIFRNYYD
jgi:hypothetical protein